MQAVTRSKGRVHLASVNCGVDLHTKGEWKRSRPSTAHEKLSSDLNQALKDLVDTPLKDCPFLYQVCGPARSHILWHSSFTQVGYISSGKDAFTWRSGCEKKWVIEKWFGLHRPAKNTHACSRVVIKVYLWQITSLQGHQYISHLVGLLWT